MFAVPKIPDSKIALEMAETLLFEFGVEASVLDEFGQTPLFYAARDGNLEVIKWLLTKG